MVVVLDLLEGMVLRAIGMWCVFGLRWVTNRWHLLQLRPFSFDELVLYDWIEESR